MGHSNTEHWNYFLYFWNYFCIFCNLRTNTNCQDYILTVRVDALNSVELCDSSARFSLNQRYIDWTDDFGRSGCCSIVRDLRVRPVRHVLGLGTENSVKCR